MRKVICTEDKHLTDNSSLGMNTQITHRVFGRNAPEAVNSANAEMERLEKIMSRYIPESEISLINQFSGIKPVKVCDEVYRVLSCANELSGICDGLFDVTIGPLVDLWNYKHAPGVPEGADISQALSLVGYCDLLLNPSVGIAGLGKQGQSIDLGGVGKGFASDRIIEIFKCYDIVSAFTNIGGNVSTLGNKPDGTPWMVGIRHPRQEGCLLGAVPVTGRSVVTSGDYERYFIDREGVRRHHILSPVTGYPAQAGLISATVISDSAMLADALSTLVFVSGLERGAGFIKRFPGTEAIMVDEHQQIYITHGLKGCFQPAVHISTKII